MSTRPVVARVASAITVTALMGALAGCGGVDVPVQGGQGNGLPTTLRTGPGAMPTLDQPTTKGLTVVGWKPPQPEATATHTPDDAATTAQQPTAGPTTAPPAQPVLLSLASRGAMPPLTPGRGQSLGLVALDEATGCLSVELGDSEATALWPAGTAWDESGTSVVLPSGRSIPLQGQVQGRTMTDAQLTAEFGAPPACGSSTYLVVSTR